MYISTQRLRVLTKKKDIKSMFITIKIWVI